MPHSALCVCFSLRKNTTTQRRRMCLRHFSTVFHPLPMPSSLGVSIAYNGRPGCTGQLEDARTETVEVAYAWQVPQKLDSKRRPSSVPALVEAVASTKLDAGQNVKTCGTGAPENWPGFAQQGPNVGDPRRTAVACGRTWIESRWAMLLETCLPQYRNRSNTSHDVVAWLERNHSCVVWPTGWPRKTRHCKHGRQEHPIDRLRARPIPGQPRRPPPAHGQR